MRIEDAVKKYGEKVFSKMVQTGFIDDIMYSFDAFKIDIPNECYQKAYEEINKN